jgi:transcriptional regulator with XRE-family HTH domain
MAIELKILLGDAIKRKRSALGISQEELAARAGLHRTYVSDLERIPSATWSRSSW